MTSPVPSRLSPDLIARIRTIKTLVDEVYPKSIEDWIEGFELDGNPQREIYFWECMGATYAGFVEGCNFSQEHKKDVFAVISSYSLGGTEEYVLSKGYRCLKPPEVKEILILYSCAAKILYVLHRARA